MRMVVLVASALARNNWIATLSVQAVQMEACFAAQSHRVVQPLHTQA